nr:hypothetical protein [Tanacetum cinerariifolium]
MGEEFTSFELTGSRTDSSHSSISSYSTAPLSPDHPPTHVSPSPTPTRASFYLRTAHMTVRANPAMSPGLSTSVTEAMALSDLAFRKRYRSSYETPSPSLPLPAQKRYRGTFEIILDTDSEGDELGDGDTDEDREDKSLDADDEREILDDEGHCLDDKVHGLDDEGCGLEGVGLGLEEEDEVVPKGPQQAVLATNTTMGEPLGLGYGALRRHELAVKEDRVPITFEVAAPVQTPLSPEWSSGSFPISSSSVVVPLPIALPVATSTATISFLDALPPTLIADIDRDVKEMYNRSGLVRDDIFSQSYRFRSLECEQERTTMMFGALWRPVLTLEAWAGHANTRISDMLRAGYGDHRLIYDMLLQQAALQHDLQEMRGRVTTLENKRDHKEQ